MRRQLAVAENCQGASVITTLAEKIRYLADPASYADEPRGIEVKETHMSWVFLGKDRVLKLKKPVRYPFLDFGTLARRKFFCEEELRLNRRLAAETYRSVIPLYRRSTGHLGFEPPGRIVEWLVVMRRLPEEDMLDVRIRDKRLGNGELLEVASKLADFYATCPSQPVAGSIYPALLVREQRMNRSILSRAEFGLGQAGVVELLDDVDNGLADMRQAIEARVAAGQVVEGHGDLRPEHVCLVAPPQIIDCLEFNRAMRMLEPYDEVNYLGLECSILGADGVRTVLLDALGRRIGNRPEEALLGLYGGFRCLLRARLCLAHLLERPVRHPEKWRPMALAYLAIAARECASLRRAKAPKSIRPNAAV